MYFLFSCLLFYLYDLVVWHNYVLHFVEKKTVIQIRYISVNNFRRERESGEVFFCLLSIPSTEKLLQLKCEIPATAQAGSRTSLACAVAVFKHAENKCSRSIPDAVINHWSLRRRVSIGLYFHFHIFIQSWGHIWQEFKNKNRGTWLADSNSVFII